MSEDGGGCLKNIIMFAVGLFCIAYLLNPTGGMDFIPDIIPIFGNLDEATAVVILLGCLRYFGFNVDGVLNLFSSSDRAKAVNARIVDEDEEK
jgi:uncharacterized membrane protein YkvA (DUF1232 family)